MVLIWLSLSDQIQIYNVQLWFINKRDKKRFNIYIEEWREAVIVQARHLKLVRYLVNYFFGLDMPTNGYTAYSYCTIFSSIRGKKKVTFIFSLFMLFFYFLMYDVRLLLRSIMHRRRIEMDKTLMAVIYT